MRFLQALENGGSLFCLPIKLMSGLETAHWGKAFATKPDNDLSSILRTHALIQISSVIKAFYVFAFCFEAGLSS